ncbi:MAG: hypothetical protein ACYDA2_03930 [Acidimicrobiales bacterium]
MNRPRSFDLSPPTAAEVLVLSRGIRAAAEPAGGLTDTQALLLGAVAKAMTGFPATLDAPGIEPAEFAEELRQRNLEFRTRIVQLMVLLALTLRPLPEDVVTRIDAFAAALGVEEGMLHVAHRFASGSLGLAAFDFERNGYTSTWHHEDASALHTSAELASAWEACVKDPDLAARWRSLESLPEGTLGRRVSDFYRARGFVYPGLPGSAPPLLAQHDWVHVLADYGTTVESELEVFAFIARANDDLHAFSLLAMVVGLFETGYLRTAAGLFEASPGHLAEAGMAARLADAMRRGATCKGSVDFMRLDWFELAELPLEEVRRRFDVTPKWPDALAAGSVGPWERGGISPFQVRAGSDLARAEGRRYDPYGADVAAPA